MQLSSNRKKEITRNRLNQESSGSQRYDGEAIAQDFQLLNGTEYVVDADVLQMIRIDLFVENSYRDIIGSGNTIAN